MLLPFLPEFIIIQILSFHHPYKSFFTSHVLKELKQVSYYKRVMKQLLQFSTYDVNRNLIRFEKYSILSVHNNT